MSKFSILNESDLHKTLKIFYQESFNGKSEVAMDGYVYDILTNDNQIIEIQTKNLSKLSKKIKDTINKGYHVKIVHPIIIKKTIYLYDKDNKLIKKRVSPQKECIYSIFKELTGLAAFLQDKNFSLEIVEISMIEDRLQMEDNVQSKNKKRRFTKNWLKTNKHLENIYNIKTFTSTQDYINLLPQNLPDVFCAKNLCELLKKQKLAPASIYKNTNLILWVLNKANIIELKDIKKKTKYYSVIQNKKICPII